MTMLTLYNEYVGPAQITGLLILSQRGFEELHSARNTQRLIAAGGFETGQDFYPVVAATHIGWIFGLIFLIPAQSPVFWPALFVYLILQVMRYWTIGTLGKYWTHRIINLPGAPIETKGPYSFVRHPNYKITIAETFLLPACFGAYEVSLIFGSIWWSVIHYKTLIEDRALESRRVFPK